jgi:hypothetical protein
MVNQKDHNKEVVTLTEAHIRYASVGILLSICFALIVGYYWGKKAAYAEFLETCRSESFNDKVAATLCALYDTGNDEVAENSADAQEESTADTAGQGHKEGQEAQYFAELIGFGTVQQAKYYANQLKNKKIKSYIIEHKSRTARGKTRTWYQVLTAPMSYDALQVLVNRIKLEDHLQGVSIVEFSPKYKERFERALA